MANNSSKSSKSVASSGSSVASGASSSAVSLNGKVWQMPLQNKEVYIHLKKCGKSEFLANIIACNARLNGFERKEEYNQFYSAPASSCASGSSGGVGGAGGIGVGMGGVDDAIESFLNPKIKQLMPSPFELMDMEKAAKHIINCIKNKSKIALFSDYDVDGAVSAAVLIKFLRMFHVEPITYIPDRIEEGYGPNVKAFAKLKESGVETIITLDCGIVAFESIDYANNNDLNVIVVDHHKGGAKNPNATAIVNPNRCDETSELGYICGATVAFMLCTAIYMILNRNEKENVDKDCAAFEIMQNGVAQNGMVPDVVVPDRIEKNGLNSNYASGGGVGVSVDGDLDVPRGTLGDAGAGGGDLSDSYAAVDIAKIRQSLTDMLDLVALATVCDVVPLIKLNRALANTGISLMNNTKNIGIREMLLQTGFNFNNEKITARTLGFTLGPIINAGGRIGNSALAAHLLSTNNVDDAKKTAAELIGFNIKRREIEQEITNEAIQRCTNIVDGSASAGGVGAGGGFDVSVVGDVDVPRGTLGESSKLFVFEYSKKWHPGIIGIVASRVKDRYSKLSIIGSLNVCDGKEFITASCRSIPAIDIGSIVIAGVEDGILLKGGGHAAAAGFTVELSKVDEFIVFVNKKIREIAGGGFDVSVVGDVDVPRGTLGDGLSDSGCDGDSAIDISTVKTLHVDAALSIKSLFDDGLWSDMKILEPFGCQNEEPVFLFKKLTLKSANIVKEKHLRLFFRCDVSGDTINAMMFGKIGTKLGDVVNDGVGRVFDVVGTISNDPKWNKISITVIDACVYL